MIATVSPGPTPKAASPPSYRSAHAAYSRQVRRTASPGVRSATASPRSAAVRRNAAHSEASSSAAGRAAVAVAAALGGMGRNDTAAALGVPAELPTRRSDLGLGVAL